MRTLFILLEKEFKRIFRDKFMPKLIVIVPMIQLLLLPFAANFEMRNINTIIIDRDNSTFSKRLSEKINASEYFNITHERNSHYNAMTEVEKNSADLILEIPKDFEKFLTTTNQADVSLTFNAINGIKGGLGASYLGNILQDFSIELYRASPTAQNIHFINALTEYRFNPHLNFKAFIVPGVLVFLLSLIGGLLASLNIVSEKEHSTIEQMNVSPISKSIFIASKLIPIWVIGLFILTLGMIVAYATYGLFPTGGFWIIYAFAAVYLVAFTGFGLMISNYSSSAQQAILTFIFFVMIFLLMSGLFTPISSMPDWAQKITIFNPVKYFIEVMRYIYLKGANFADIQNNFLTICVFAIVINVCAIIGFRRNSN